MSIKVKVLSQHNENELTRSTIQKLDLSSFNASDVSLNISRSDIVGLDRVGNDLMVELGNGDVETLKNFFEDNADGKKNKLFVS